MTFGGSETIMEGALYMTASRIKIEDKPALKLNIHQYTPADATFFDSLGIIEKKDEEQPVRTITIHSQEDFLAIRGKILEVYNVLAEKGPRVFLEAK